jgi:hypothetical protein
MNKLNNNLNKLTKKKLTLDTNINDNNINNININIQVKKMDSLKGSILVETKKNEEFIGKYQ